MTSDSHTDGLVTKEQAFTDARRVLDMARERRDRDRARGVLPPQVEFMLRRIEYRQLAQPARYGTDEDVVLSHIAGQWHSRTTFYTSLIQLAKATGLGITELRGALTHLTTVSEVQLFGRKTSTPVDAVGVTDTASFEVLADWHLINRRRPRRPELAEAPVLNSAKSRP
ncbi:hypothetical protein [Streptomyces vinaceus]|uniref:hypothetical protein n=1 Tax=Streptomyces vinaceus TaxID=1960 RepID=UPI0035DA4CF7